MYRYECKIAEEHLVYLPSEFVGTRNLDSREKATVLLSLGN